MVWLWHWVYHNILHVCIYYTYIYLHGDGSKPWHLVNIKIAGKWMFIPLKMVLIGIDPYPHIYIIVGHVWCSSLKIFKSSAPFFTASNGYQPASGATLLQPTVRPWHMNSSKYSNSSNFRESKAVGLSRLSRPILRLRKLWGSFTPSNLKLPLNSNFCNLGGKRMCWVNAAPKLNVSSVSGNLMLAKEWLNLLPNLKLLSFAGSGKKTGELKRSPQEGLLSNTGEELWQLWLLHRDIPYLPIDGHNKWNTKIIGNILSFSTMRWFFLMFFLRFPKNRYKRNREKWLPWKSQGKTGSSSHPFFAVACCSTDELEKWGQIGYPNLNSHETWLASQIACKIHDQFLAGEWTSYVSN